MASTSAEEPSSAMTESPNWLETPHDLMVNILQRLGIVEILKSARRVCTTWRRICNDPAMWKVINVHKSVTASETDYEIEMLTKQAVDRSCGELVDISLVCFGTNNLLDYILLRSKKLKRLCLISCINITGSGLSRAVKRVPQLEELCISFTRTDVNDIEAIGQNCPQLKYFMLDKRLVYPCIKCDDGAFAIANNMPELRRLKLIDRGMTNDGLEAILDGCPHLQSLDVRMCYNISIHGNLQKLCMERIKDFKH